ncbi:hypothetical protein GALMADRAFT_242258 [Galerina marginata CBS 339.88]|uniref:Uncharacterized protein n=1 Tax=Galerina marginata (strain CBS 339.88) TaxID=685588 RepID=A0A067TA94_GALM3|nr:hypothetical protein GALMADRAFT_242258 [Galerina marginata CBS 339.88]
MPLGTEKNAASNSTGLIDQSTEGLDLKDEVQDAIQGKDSKSRMDSEEDVWGVEKGAGKDF